MRRTGKARFNPMRVWLRSEGCVVACDYEVHVGEGKPVDAGRQLLDGAVTGRLKDAGLAQTTEKVEAWHGHMVTRRYEGQCAAASSAASAVRLVCEYTEQVMDTATQ